MAKPQINRIAPFDAANDTTISFRWTGFQPYANRIRIYDNSTLDMVWENQIDSMLSQHPIPAHTLENGKTYLLQCQVMDSAGNQSEWSNKYYFKTYTTPLFSFDNISNDETITTSSCHLSVFYYQQEAEPLYCYRFALYDSQRKLITETGDSYITDSITHTFRGLDTEASYLVRCYGTTQNGITVDTGYIRIHVDYGFKSYYARIYVENEERTGGIHYRTNLNVILPDGDNYQYEDGKINLVDKSIVYQSGFKINSDFTLKLSGSCLYRQGTVLTMNNQDGSITISAYVYDDGAIRYRLLAPNGISTYLIYSNPIICGADDLITLAVRRQNHLYTLQAYLT